MAKRNIHDIHHRLQRLGIPILSVQLTRDAKGVTLLFQSTATDDQKAVAQKIADEWDQEAFDAAQSASFDNLPSVEVINEATTAKELQPMALALRAYVDDHR